MPFGLKNAPGTFQRAADIILASVKWQYALVYLDDVIVYSKSIEEHFGHLDHVLQLMHDAGLTLKLNKCEFFRSSVDYLGQVISPGKLQVTQRAIEAIKKARHPLNVSEMRSFLGLCNVYRRFVKGFTKIANPLNRKLRKGEKPTWSKLTDEEQLAFETLKEALTSPLILALPRAGFPYILDTDACDVHVGCVLQQEQPEGKPRPVGFWSRSLSQAECNYDTTNKACLAIVWAVLILRPYLEGARFLIRTDHDALKWMMNLTGASGRLLRWRLRLLEFDFIVTHRPGVQHKVADAMSRLSTDGHDTTELDDEIPTINVAEGLPDETEELGLWEVEHIAYEDLGEPGLPQVMALKDVPDVRPITREELVAAQKDDLYCSQVRSKFGDKH